jgi:hypothetical protein
MDKTFLGIAAIGIGALLPLVLRLLTRISTLTATAKQIPDLLAQLSRLQSYPAFVTFVFSAPDQPGDDHAMNVQFSVEGGTTGFDWVLLAPRNLSDEKRFLEFARALGFAPSLKEMNNVRYWRVEHGDIASLCGRVITEMYGMSDTQPIDLVVEGFKWKPPAT